MTQRLRAAVIGAGSWGTTFAAVLADAGCQVQLLARDPQVAARVQATRYHEKYLPGIRLPDAIDVTAEPQGALASAELVVVAVPSKAVRSTGSALREFVPSSAIAVSLIKGVELGTDYRMSEVIAEVWGVAAEQIAVVSGPNLAREIAERQPTATVVSSVNASNADRVADACSTSYFRPYTNTDVVGVELCGAAKNVIALAVGIAQGRGYGYNTTASIITRGLVEITRLGIVLGAHPQTFAGLAGMGDLMATCTSPLSRNHRLGRFIGQGMSLKHAIEMTGGTAEGVMTSRSILDLAHRAGVEMPISAGVAAVLHDGLDVDEMARGLLTRPRKSESAQDY